MQSDRVTRLLNDGQSADSSPAQLHPEGVPEAVWSGPLPSPSCRAEIPLSPDSIRAAGDLADHLPAAGLFVMLLTLSVVIVRLGRVFAATRRSSPEAPSVRYGTPAFAPAPFGSRAMAERAAAHENTAYWQHLLAAFGAALEDEGYALSNDPRGEVKLPESTRLRVGCAVIRARQRCISPLQHEASREAFLQQAAEDGYAGSWADWCQRGAEAAGWYVVRQNVDRDADSAATD
ncbi:hypothetical protein [Pantoea cypripedii]|uniref:Uncharacterized protein n=1 Tax=Pantoea cypripedii TaxID=55209 RepID=A0A1X1EM95_PANCY|nr:hypothetical protein [Pantoea cypripedii]MBP2200581.1 hypothetical protein [Pantoea cypripedii]ORM90077.1 hypothetical protein HA50_26255 [Pantoea cypripedii]